jgi:RNA polymerase II subunit A C-terminal domain phosphatase SSU72
MALFVRVILIAPWKLTSFWEMQVRFYRFFRREVLFAAHHFSLLHRSSGGKLWDGNSSEVGAEQVLMACNASVYPKPLTNIACRLPGRSAMEPRIFKFGTPYEEMFKSMVATPEDEAFFVRNGVLQLCRRGAAVKKAPQRWQDQTSEFVAQHDVVIAFEERIFDAVVEDLQIREPTENFAPIHVICLDTKDNPHEAQLQGQVALELCWELEQAGDELVAQAAEIVDRFQNERMNHTPIKVLYQLCYL